MDAKYQPTAVGVTIALNMNNKGVENQIIDTQGIEKVTPIMVQECKKDKNKALDNVWLKNGLK